MTLNLTFGVWPYLAILLLVAGITLRCLLTPARPGRPDIRLREALAQLAGKRLRRIALVILALVHLTALAFPHSLLSWTKLPQYLVVWEGVACAAAVVLLAGWVKLVWRQLAHADGSPLAQIADTVVVALLVTGALSGVSMAVLHRWASAWGALLLTPYMQSVLTGNPAVEQLTQVPLLARVHVFSMITLPAVFPFSRFAVLLIEPLQSGAAGLLRLFTAVSVPCRRTLYSGLRRASLAFRLSAEEE